MSDSQGDVRAMIAEIARSLVDKPEEVIVDMFEDGGEMVLELEVAPEDVGKVIGRQGRTVRAMRNLLGAAGEKHDTDYALEIIE